MDYISLTIIIIVVVFFFGRFISNLIDSTNRIANRELQQLELSQVVRIRKENIKVSKEIKAIKEAKSSKELLESLGELD